MASYPRFSFVTHPFRRIRLARRGAPPNSSALLICFLLCSRFGRCAPLLLPILQPPGGRGTGSAFTPLLRGKPGRPGDARFSAVFPDYRPHYFRREGNRERQWR